MSGTLETHHPTKLALHNRNPRRGDVDAIAGSLRANGQYKPIVVNRGTYTGRPMEVLAGNHTLMAVRNLAEEYPSDDRWQQVDCWVIDVDEDRAVRIVAADNRTSELGTFDDRLLAELLAELDDLEGTGYDPQDLDDLANMLASEGEDGDGGEPDWDEEGEEGDGDLDIQPYDGGPGLADRFGVPPFTVLDTRSGAWRARSRAWRQAGINSEAGRDERLLYQAQLAVYANWYEVRAAAHKVDPTLTADQIEERYRDQLVPFRGGGATSIFDPVLAELLVSWFSPPGGHVVDPWAGGSVRGIVSAALGRNYTGIDLSDGQVAANQAQWELVKDTIPNLESAQHTTADPLELTPVQRVLDHWVKRDDHFAVGDSRGGKVRTCLHIAQQAADAGAHTLVTAGSRHSPQVNIVTEVALQMGMTAELHVPSGELTEELEAAQAAGAVLEQHTPGYNTVIVKRARDAAEQDGHVEVPFGMDHPAAVEYTARQVQNLPADVTRIVVPVGSGMSLAGILTGLQQTGRDDVHVLGIRVGADPTDRLERYAPTGWQDNCTLVDAQHTYEEIPDQTFLGHVSLDPHYEAKCLPFLEPGDLLWIVGRRATAPDDLPVTGGLPSPVWLTGDSREVLPTLDAEQYDMVLGCPPYYDLEEYGDNPADLSNMTTAEFDAAMADTLRKVDATLRPHSFAAFVVGAVRDKRGNLRDMKRCMIQAAESAGWALANDAVLVNAIGTVAIRAGRAFSLGRSLGRTHQDIVVFVKGDRKQAAQRCGESVALAALPPEPTAE